MEKYYSLVLLSVMIALLSSACSSDDEEKQVFTVASKTVVLPYGEGQPTRLYYVKTPSGSTWSPTFIENLDYEPGYEYVIEVKETGFRTDYMGYICLRVLSKTKKESEGLPNIMPKKTN